MLEVSTDLRPLLAVSLRRTVRGRVARTKTIMRWTGASERTVKNWLSGANIPSGTHLVELARHSDEVFDLLLMMTGRGPIATPAALHRLRSELARAIEQIDRQLGP